MHDSKPVTWSVTLPELWRIRAGDVHVWCVNTPMLIERISDFFELLSIDEKERARSYRSAIHRNRFVVARGTLRLLLSRYLDTSPLALYFGNTAYGKPRIDNEYDIEFSVSHSEELILYAFACIPRVGIDVEALRWDVAVPSIAELVLTPRERRSLMLTSSFSERVGLFFKYWTCKEACLKATGQGLYFPMVSLDMSVSHLGGNPLIVETNIYGPPPITVVPFNPQYGYCAALAIENVICHISWYRVNRHTISNLVRGVRFRHPEVP